MSAPTKSPSSRYEKNIVRIVPALVRACSTVANRQCGSNSDLYGSTFSTPCSPRPTR